MPYSKNPYLPKVRMEAVNLVYQGWSTRKVARHFGLGSWSGILFLVYRACPAAGYAASPQSSQAGE